MAGGTGKAPLHIQLRQKLQGDDVSTDWLNHSIFKVPNHLRQISEKAYEPQVISIGPYHHGKGQLKKMEGYKMFYLKMLLKRRQEISLERYVTALKGMEANARKFYSEPLNHIGGEEFVEMMLLDGCFIIELIRKIAMKKLRLKNDHLLKHFILRRVMLDLLLVENQLPFFILTELFDMTVSDDEKRDFMDMAINNFLSIVMPLPGSQISRPNNQVIKHLLGLLHYCWAFKPGSRGVHFSSPEDPELLEEGRSLSPQAKLNLCSSEVVGSSPLEPSEEARVPLLKVMDISCSSPSNLSEEELTAAAFVSLSPPKSSTKTMAAASVGFSPTAQSTSFLPPKSSKEIYCTSASSVDFSVTLDMDALEAKQSIRSSLLRSSEEVEIEPNVSRGVAPLAPTKGYIKCASSHKRNEWKFIRSATELTEAGINFKKIERGLFDINFEKGVMSIPTLTINDDAESLLRNLVAYEQCFNEASSKCSNEASSKCFTDYITFMDCLINTGKDVELLCLHGVIDNWLGDDEVVATMFNKLRDSVLISQKDFHYAKTFNKVNEHCDRIWNRWKENLWHNYFNTPWAGISFFAAVFWLLLTVLQSVYSVLSYQFK